MCVGCIYVLGLAFDVMHWGGRHLNQRVQAYSLSLPNQSTPSKYQHNNKHKSEFAAGGTQDGYARLWDGGDVEEGKKREEGQQQGAGAGNGDGGGSDMDKPPPLTFRQLLGILKVGGGVLKWGAKRDAAVDDIYIHTHLHPKQLNNTNINHSPTSGPRGACPAGG